METATVHYKPKINKSMFTKLSAINDEVSDAENEEILHILESLTDDDLQIVRSEYITVP